MCLESSTVKPGSQYNATPTQARCKNRSILASEVGVLGDAPPQRFCLRHIVNQPLDSNRETLLLVKSSF